MTPLPMLGRFIALCVVAGMATNASAATLGPASGDAGSASSSPIAEDPAEPGEVSSDSPEAPAGDPGSESPVEPADAAPAQPDPEPDPATSAPPPASGPPPVEAGSSSAPLPSSSAPPPVAPAAASPWGGGSQPDSGSTSPSTSPWGGDDGKSPRRRDKRGPPKPGTGLIIGGSVGLLVGVIGLGVMGSGLSRASDATDALAASSPGSRTQIFEDGEKANKRVIAGAVVMSIGMGAGITLVALGAKKRARGTKTTVEPSVDATGAGLRIRGRF